MVTVVLVVSAELAHVSFVLPIGFSVDMLQYNLVLVHENSLVGGVEQSVDFLPLAMVR